MELFKIVLIVLIVVISKPVLACDVCGCRVNNEGIPTEQGFSVGAFEQYTTFGTLQFEGHEVENVGAQFMNSSVTQFIVGYQIDDEWAVQFNLPFIERSFRRPRGFEVDEGSISGLGDSTLMGTCRAFEFHEEECAFDWNIVGGIKFPTGSSHRIKEELDEVEVEGAPKSGIHGHDLALGSGSFDGVIGTSVFGQCDRFFGTAAMQYAIRTRGTIGYRYANDMTWNGGPGVYVWKEEEGTLGLQCNVSGESKGVDNLQGVPALDTASTNVYLGPELTFLWEKHLNVEVGVDLPVIQKNSAFQIVPDIRVHGGVNWRF